MKGCVCHTEATVAFYPNTITVFRPAVNVSPSPFNDLYKLIFGFYKRKQKWCLMPGFANISFS